jgi:GNAT superfamily N-acetyltransferase
VNTARHVLDIHRRPPRRSAPEAQALLEVPAGYGGRGRWLVDSDAPALQTLLDRCRHEVALATGAARGADAARLLRMGGPATAGAAPEDRFVAGIFSDEGELNAFVDVVRDHPAPGVFSISSLVVRPELRGCGVAAQVLEAVEAWARAEGATAVHLHVSRRNAGAMAFALRAGFADAGDAPARPGFEGIARLAQMARSV